MTPATGWAKGAVVRTPIGWGKGAATKKLLPSLKMPPPLTTGVKRPAMVTKVKCKKKE